MLMIPLQCDVREAPVACFNAGQKVFRRLVLEGVRASTCGRHRASVRPPRVMVRVAQVQIPGTPHSFATIFSIEDPDGGNEHSGVGMQVTRGSGPEADHSLCGRHVMTFCPCGILNIDSH